MTHQEAHGYEFLTATEVTDAIGRGDFDGPGLDSILRAAEDRKRSIFLRTVAPIAAPAAPPAFPPFNFGQLGRHDRKRAAAAEAIVAQRLVPGSRARIKSDAPLRPAYLRGVTGVILRVNEITATLKFDEGQDLRRFGAARDVRVPLTCLERLP